jgi:DNA-binding NtrC family response regulator
LTICPKGDIIKNESLVGRSRLLRALWDQNKQTTYDKSGETRKKFMKPKILFIDDDDDLRRLYAEILEEKYDVTSCGHMAAGLSYIRRDHDWDLVISDYNNPVTEGGIQIVKAAREYAPGVPVMIISGDVVSWYDIQTKCEADAYLEKPFGIATFTDIIENCLRSRKQSILVVH